MAYLLLLLHGKKAIVEPARKLTAAELKIRVCDDYGCDLLSPSLKIGLMVLQEGELTLRNVRKRRCLPLNNMQ
jgi:hypothetical protein